MHKSMAVGLLAIVGCAGTSSNLANEDPHAWVGVETRAPGKNVVEALRLPTRVRVQGQEIVSIAKGSPAAASGLAPGDVLLSLDANELYSHDDVADFLATARPGQKVAVSFRRPGREGTQETNTVLGRNPAPPESSRFRWDFAGLAQLDVAEERARTSGRSILVGLSGAET
jgi:S1-C subfamily serine protease